MSRHFTKSDFVCIRAMLASDCRQVLALQQQLFPDDPIALRPEHFETRPLSMRGMVAVSEGQVIGFTILRDRPWRFWTSGDFFGLASEFRDKGIGRSLLDAALLHKTRPAIRIFCRPSNQRALALYRTGGFKDIGVRKRNYPDGEDAIILMKWLGL